MATLSGDILFTGSIGGLSAYKMKGVDKIILRRKPETNKHKFEHNPNNAIVKRYNEEWKGCIMAGKAIRQAMPGVQHLRDYNYSGSLNALCKSIQGNDRQSPLGSRSVLLSQAAAKLEGFGLNRVNTLGSILHDPPACTLSKEKALAQIQVPPLIPGVNFSNPSGQPLFRLVFVLAAVSDIVYNHNIQKYQLQATELPAPQQLITPWQNTPQGHEAVNLQLALHNWQNTAATALLLWGGVEFGVPISSTVIRYVKYSGAASILKAV